MGGGGCGLMMEGVVMDDGVDGWMMDGWMGWMDGGGRRRRDGWVEG